MDGYARREKLRIEVLNTKEELEHFHQDIELIYILEGTMEVQIGEQKTFMNPEDILVMNANKKHCFKASSNILFARLFITYQLVSDIFQSVDIIFWCDSTTDESERYEELRKVMKKLLNHYLSTEGGVANFGHIALCYQVMDLLSVHFLVRAVDKENLDDKERFEERIVQIDNYIRANYNKPISLKDLAEKLYLSNGYLSRFFKKNYGMSFAEYLSDIRLYYAVDELLYTNMPITRIAYDNGFASVAVFNKLFKKTYGDTPSAMRRKSKEQKDINKKTETNQVVKERLEQFLLTDGARKEENQDVQVRKDTYSVKEYKKTQYSWNNMINVGSAEELLKSEVREHILLLKEMLGFQYVRFWNLFSKELLIDITREEQEYNFSKLDSIMDFLMQHGMKPHIELGMKPKRILKNVQSALLIDHSNIGFVNLDQWLKVIHAMMRHLIRRYGRSEVNTWRMELWFDEEKWDQSAGTPEYCDLFNQTYEAIKKYSEKIEIGGCGLRLDYIEKNQNGFQFLKEWRSQRCQPDYLSILYYGYERGEINQDRYSKRSTDYNGMLHRVSNAVSILKKAGFEDKKIYITEWNLTISDRNYMNDTCFKGAYIVKNLLDLYGQVEETAYFLGSDRISEYYDSTVMLHGGTGLISKDGILKPAGFAFEFLNRLYPYYIGKNENCLITTDAHDSYGIVCHNQKALNYNYYFTQEDQIEKEHIWKYFENRDSLQLKLHLTHVENGVYQIKTYRINEQNGSVLSIWAEMEFESELSRNDIKYFKRSCEPKLTIQKCEAENQTLSLSITLEANEIAFIRIRKYFP